jgi:hypothetical protein
LTKKIILAYVEGSSEDEISQTTGTPLKEVQRVLSNWREGPAEGGSGFEMLAKIGVLTKFNIGLSEKGEDFLAQRGLLPGGPIRSVGQPSRAAPVVAIGGTGILVSDSTEQIIIPRRGRGRPRKRPKSASGKLQETVELLEKAMGKTEMPRHLSEINRALIIRGENTPLTRRESAKTERQKSREYNLFLREKIKAGMSKTDAIAAWKEKERETSHQLPTLETSNKWKETTQKR